VSWLVDGTVPPGDGKECDFALWWLRSPPAETDRDKNEKTHTHNLSRMTLWHHL
jgi:hypothetical protein